MSRILAPLLALLLSAGTSLAKMAPREGWSVRPTSKAYDRLVADVKAAVTRNGFSVVTEAGPTGAARARGVTIPGNRVIGVFNNVDAVRVLELSTAAMIEAPIRLYVTEDADGTATLSYKLPSTVFAPYMDEAGPELAAIATELDTAFVTIAEAAVR